MKRQWLIQLRKSKKLTQKYISTAAFIDRSYYSQIESGKRNPSIIVAKSIGDVLDFDPIKFFQDDINQLSDELGVSEDNPTIAQRLRGREGHILYLVNEHNLYFEHTVTFVYAGIESGSHCYLFDHHKNLVDLQNKLIEIFDKSTIKKFIHFINTDSLILTKSEDIKCYIQSLFSGMEETICVWGFRNEASDNDWISLLQDFLNTNNLCKLFVASYTAHMLTADIHINLMRKFEYLMTDFEFVESPLYTKSAILPSLYIQENI